MTNYILRRLIGMIPVLFGITLISFFVIHLAPGKPTDVMTDLNPKVSQESRLKLAELYGFDKPVYEQYFVWLSRIVKLDFGASFLDGRRVADKIAERLPVTIGINLLSVILIFGAAIPIGVKGALHYGSIFDRVTTSAVFLMFSLPSFWVGLLAISFFGVQMGWLPVSGITSLDFASYSLWGKCVDIMRHLILPVVVTSIGGIAGISRYTRDRMIDVMNEDYIRTAVAKGLPKNKVISKHAVRNALMPVITIAGLMIPGLISGSVISETIFNIPGMGRLMVDAVFTRDYNLIMGELVIVTFLTLAGNFAADIVYALCDPRIKFGEKK